MRSEKNSFPVEASRKKTVDNPFMISRVFWGGDIQQGHVHGEFAMEILQLKFDLVGEFVGYSYCNLFGYRFKHDEIYNCSVGHGAVPLTPQGFG